LTLARLSAYDNATDVGIKGLPFTSEALRIIENLFRKVIFGAGVLNASQLDHNKRIVATYLLFWVTSNGTLGLLYNALGLSKMLMMMLQT